MQSWMILATVLALIGVTGAVVVSIGSSHDPPQADSAQHTDGKQHGDRKHADGKQHGDGKQRGKGKKKPHKDKCVATAGGGHKVKLSREEATNAATIAAVALERGLPKRAISIALATAFQESYLRNLDYGDRDSLGLFQQRPSQGWGSPKQVRNPVYAAEKFYDALGSIPQYGKMKITDAAQAVQRSAYPKAYAKHGRNARTLAKALSGHSEGTLHCTYQADEPEREKVGKNGLTPRTTNVLKEVTNVFGSGDKVSNRQVHKSPFYDGLAFDIYFKPHNKKVPNRQGWQVAHWLAVNADRLDLSTIIYDDKIWTERRSHKGWRPYTPPSGDPKNPTLRHLDRVHVAVARGR